MEPGDVISYNKMVVEEDGLNLQRGMNFRIQDIYSIFLMSTREGAPSVRDLGDEVIKFSEGNGIYL